MTTWSPGARPFDDLDLAADRADRDLALRATLAAASNTNTLASLPFASTSACTGTTVWRVAAPPPASPRAKSWPPVRARIGAPSAATSISTSKVPVTGSALEAMLLTRPANSRPGQASNATRAGVADAHAHRVAVGEPAPHDPAAAGAAEHQHRLAGLHEFVGLGEPQRTTARRVRRSARSAR